MEEGGAGVMVKAGARPGTGGTGEGMGGAGGSGMGGGGSGMGGGDPIMEKRHLLRKAKLHDMKPQIIP